MLDMFIKQTLKSRQLILLTYVNIMTHWDVVESYISLLMCAYHQQALKAVVVFYIQVFGFTASVGGPFLPSTFS